MNEAQFLTIFSQGFGYQLGFVIKLMKKCEVCGKQIFLFNAVRCGDCGGNYYDCSSGEKVNKAIKQEIEARIKILFVNGFNINQITKSLNISKIDAVKVIKKRIGLSLETKNNILSKYGNKCFVCEKNKKLLIHHDNRIPSDNRLDNLTPLCISCHKKVHIKMYSEY